MYNRQQEILLEAEAAVRAREEALNQVWQIFAVAVRAVSPKPEYIGLNLETQELGRLRDELERQKAAHQVGRTVNCLFLINRS